MQNRSAEVSALLPVQVIKRDGCPAAFDADKIHAAILKAGRATGAFDENETVWRRSSVPRCIRDSWTRACVRAVRHDVLTCPTSTNVGYVGDGKYLPTQSHIEEDRS
jgi:hypothetical protein